MAKKKSWGGKRKGAGPHTRVIGEKASEKVLLAFTEGEYAALRVAHLALGHVMAADEAPFARWLVETLIKVLMVPCKHCGAPVAGIDGTPLYAAPHVCETD